MDIASNKGNSVICCPSIIFPWTIFNAPIYMPFCDGTSYSTSLSTFYSMKKVVSNASPYILFCKKERTKRVVKGRSG